MLASKGTLKVALIQMQSKPDISKNLIDAITFFHEAVTTYKAELIVFPENFLCIGLDDYSDHVTAFESAINKFKDLAVEHKVSIVLGSIPFPVSKNSKKCYSRSLLINELGSIVCAYDKIHLFDALVDDGTGGYLESSRFEGGYKTIVGNVAQKKIGLSICYDLRFPELYQSLRLQGAQMLAVPSAFTYRTGKAHWEILLKARAIETQSFVLAANQCGEHLSISSNAIRKTWGHSMIIDPWGRELASLKHTPGVCAAELDFNELSNIRQTMNLVGHKRL